MSAIADRLKHFYAEYCPEKANDDFVKEAMKRWVGREEEMFAALVQKYGPEPATMSSHESGGREIEFCPNAQYAAELFEEAPADGSEPVTQDEGAQKETNLFARYAAELFEDAEHTDVVLTESNASLSYQSRLIAFYTRYAPDKLSTVDATLTKYAGREELMFEALVAKYGPEPPMLVLASPAGGSGDDNLRPDDSSAAEDISSSHSSQHRSRLVAFYRHHAPDHVALVDKMLLYYKGKEELMFETLAVKYGSEDTTTPVGRSTHGDDAVVCRLVRFYKKYNPDHLAEPHLTRVMDTWKGRTDDLFHALERKYGPEPPTVTPVGSGWRHEDLLHIIEASLGPYPELMAALSALPIEGDIVLLQGLLLNSVNGRCDSQEIHKILQAVENARFVPTASSAADVLRNHAVRIPVDDAEALEGIPSYSLLKTVVLDFAATSTLLMPVIDFVGRSASITSLVIEGFCFANILQEGNRSPTTSELLAKRLELFYSKHKPSNVQHIPTIVRAYGEQPRVLFEQLQQRYGEDVPELQAAEHSPAWNDKFTEILERCVRCSKLTRLRLVLPQTGDKGGVSIPVEAIACFGTLSGKLNDEGFNRDSPLQVLFPPSVSIPFNAVQGNALLQQIDPSFFALVPEFQMERETIATSCSLREDSHGASSGHICLVMAEHRETLPCKGCVAHSMLLRDLFEGQTPAKGEVKDVPISIDRAVPVERLAVVADFIRMTSEAEAAQSQVYEDDGDCVPLLTSQHLALAQRYLPAAVASAQKTINANGESNEQSATLQVLFELMELAIYLNMPCLKRFLRSLFVLACGASKAMSITHEF